MGIYVIIICRSYHQICMFFVFYFFWLSPYRFLAAYIWMKQFIVLIMALVILVIIIS